ncbi:hypothetical protein BvRS1_43050 [Burkholderia vietnamiensis]|nr:hypothetical protein BvRS1_43050 [Burkholderia vietnamiensis]
MHPETGHIVKMDQVWLLGIQYGPEVLRDAVVPEIVAGFERRHAGTPHNHPVVIFSIETASGVCVFRDPSRKHDHVMTARRQPECLTASHNLGTTQHVWWKQIADDKDSPAALLGI